jgi:hypothetical protein
MLPLLAHVRAMMHELKRKNKAMLRERYTLFRRGILSDPTNSNY